MIETLTAKVIESATMNSGSSEVLKSPANEGLNSFDLSLSRSAFEQVKQLEEYSLKGNCFDTEKGSYSFSKSNLEQNLSKVEGELSESLAEDVTKMGQSIKTFDVNNPYSAFEQIEMNSYCKESDTSSNRIKTIREDLAGKIHPETGVLYVEKEVTNYWGEKLVGVFPQFASECDVQLPKDLYQASDRAQFKECNRQLKERCDNDPEFRKNLDDRIKEAVESKYGPYTPEGYVWHHNEEIGKMQLVDYETHEKSRHTGGKHVWGGGRECR